MNKITISIELANAILNHLGTRPYTEVFQLIKTFEKEVNEQTTPPKEELVEVEKEETTVTS